jgi:hypothetical protein
VPLEPLVGTRTRARAEECKQCKKSNQWKQSKVQMEVQMMTMTQNKMNPSYQVDNDYDITNGEDDLHDDGVLHDQDVKGNMENTSVPYFDLSCSKKGKEEVEAEISEDEDFWEPESDEENVKLNSNIYN